MKRLVILVVLCLALAAMMAACGGRPKEVATPEQPVAIDTTPVVEDDTPPPPPPPPAPKLEETQFATVYFDFDKFSLRPDARSGLDNNYQLLVDFPDAIVKVEGHCDERGTIEYNLSLGEKRAHAVMDYLVGLGIDPGRVSIISYGKERPVAMGSNEEAWSKNRRAEFLIVSQ